MSKELKSQLKSFRELNGRVNPDRDWVAQNKAKLMTQIGNMVDKEAHNNFSFNKFIDGLMVFVPGHTLQVMARPVMVGVLVIGFLTGGWMTTALATESCLPGDICYGVKLAAEKTQEFAVAVVGSNTSKTQLQLEFANRRAKEVKKVMEEKPDTVNAKVAIQHLQDSMQSARDSAKAVSEQSPNKSLDLAKDVNDKTKEIVNTLKEVQLNTSTINNADFAKDVVEIKRVVNEVKIAAVEMATQKSTDGSIDQNSQQKQEVKDLVMDTIKSSVNENESAKTTATEVKGITAQVVSTSSIAGSVSTTITVPVILTVSNTPQVVSTTKDLKAVVEQVVKTVDQKTEAARNTLDQAQTLADGNQLLEAIQKVKEVNDATKEVQQTVVEVKGVVTSVVNEAQKATTPAVSSTTVTTVEKK